MANQETEISTTNLSDQRQSLPAHSSHNSTPDYSSNWNKISMRRRFEDTSTAADQADGHVLEGEYHLCDQCFTKVKNVIPTGDCV
jgi:hypothetical protein